MKFKNLYLPILIIIFTPQNLFAAETDDKQIIGKMLNAYATTIGAWHIEERCNFLEDKHLTFETNINLMRDVTAKALGNKPMLNALEDSAKGTAQKAPYSDCGKKSREIVDWGVDMVQTVNKSMIAILKEKH